MKKLTSLFLLVILAAGLYGQQWENYTSGKKINALSTFNHLVWAATSSGLVKVNIYRLESTIYDKTNSEIPDNDILCISRNTTYGVWLGTRNMGIVEFHLIELLNPYLCRPSSVIS